MRGRAWHAALQWELSVRSWDESATQRRKRRGEKTHIHLDRTKEYKCARIRPRGIAPFACCKNKGSLLNCGGFVQPRLNLLVPAATKNRQLIRMETAPKMEVCLAFIGIPGYIRKALFVQKNPGVFPCCVCLLHKLTLWHIFDSISDCFSHIPSTPSLPAPPRLHLHTKPANHS